MFAAGMEQEGDLVVVEEGNPIMFAAGMEQERGPCSC